MLRSHIKYIYLTGAMIIIFWLISLFGLVIAQSKGVEIPNLGMALVYTFLNDFWLASILSLIAFVPYLLLSKWGKKYSLLFVKVIFSFFILAQIALVKYYTETFISLGADLLGYSINDMVSTVKSLDDLSLVYFLPVLLLPALLIGLYILLSKYSKNRVYLYSFGILLLVAGTFQLGFADSSSDIYQNKIGYLFSDILRFKLEKRKNIETFAEYPLIKSTDQIPDVLGPYFHRLEERPNLVFIVVEGLGRNFTGQKAQFHGFTPFLDSLSRVSLNWQNFLCNSGRSFGALPSIFGSLPFGDKGFLEIEDIPSHLSILSILKENGYEVSYYEGSYSEFDRKINFLENEGVENIQDVAKYGPDYQRIETNAADFSWGYPDKEIFRKTLSHLDADKNPRLDVIFTLTGHEPFLFPESNEYENRVDRMLESENWPAQQRRVIESNKIVFASLLYTDDAIKDFLQAYKARDDFDNTIFIITGDHRLIPIPHKDKLCRFHVPFMIYSPLTKAPRQFHSVSSHLDIAPSLMSYLRNNYGLKTLKNSAWLGEGIDTSSRYRSIRQIPLMRFKGLIGDFVYKDYFMSQNQLFRIAEDLSISQISDGELQNQVNHAFAEFKDLNKYVTENDRIFPDSLIDYRNYRDYQENKIVFSTVEQALIDKLTRQMSPNEIFQKARQLAFNDQREEARLLCDYLLNSLPNHYDARILKARTLGWDGKYEEAESVFLNVLSRNPYYDDPYLGIMDMYWWSGQDEKSIPIASKAMTNNIVNPEISFKLAKAYYRLNDSEKSGVLLDSLIVAHPENKDFVDFKRSIQQVN